ncbi:MAG: Mut7-C ubiquitin/RNAse domain-containing protein [Anaerolineae bacterium]|nr:Mut7-C ubiquitin/RNAse domain-containing protein [Anaerolineae bacterium]
MKQVHIRFYAELNRLLPAEKRQREFVCWIGEGTTVKHLIESLGVPHTEVDLIVVNGVSVGFSFQPQDGDHISVYPEFESMDISPIIHLRPKPLRETRFVLDTHLGRLAAYLRMLGFDTLYRNDYKDEELARISCEEKRVLLTRDRGLLKRKMVSHGYYVRETSAHQQAVEVLRRFQLEGQIKPFERCLKCNGLMRQVDKGAIEGKLPANTRKYYDLFYTCNVCGQIYWKGTHYQRMKTLIERIAQEVLSG